MQRSCDGRHPVLWPIRPVALMVCDTLGLLGTSKLCAAVLLGLCAGLLLLSHTLSTEFTDLVSSAITSLLKDYLSKQTSDTLTYFTLQLLLSNSAFSALRLALRVCLGAIYDLGRDTVFSVLLLALILAWGVLAYSAYVAGGLTFAYLYKSPGGAVAGLASLTYWYWHRYIASARDRRVFDHDVGRALARLRHA